MVFTQRVHPGPVSGYKPLPRTPVLGQAPLAPGWGQDHRRASKLVGQLPTGREPRDPDGVAHAGLERLVGARR
jgi:hypothetical protein